MESSDDVRRDANRSAADARAVLVTGAASGIGAAYVKMARRKGAKVYAVDRDEDSLKELAQSTRSHYEVCDLSNVEEIPGLVERCCGSIGGIDGLLNGAGIFQTRDILEISVADFDRMFAINLRALFFMMQAAAEEMIRRDGGSIVNIASTAARVPRPISSHYAASKAAVVSFTRSAAASLGPHGVRVNAICPGVIETPMIQEVLKDWAEHFGSSPSDLEAEWGSMNPMGRLGRPNEVAEVIRFLLSGDASYVNGESIGINGGTNDI
jgi:D-sorbitol dehydrogenase (acceptor)